MTQKQITNEITNSQLKMTLQVERFSLFSLQLLLLLFSPEEPSSSPVLTRSGPRLGRAGPETRGGRGWGWSTSWRQCSTTASVISPSRTTSPLAAVWASRSTNTTTPWSATMTTPSRRWGRRRFSWTTPSWRTRSWRQTARSTTRSTLWQPRSLPPTNGIPLKAPY